MITLGYTTLGKTPLDERSVRPDNTKHSQGMSLAGFETTIQASERQWAHA